MTELSNRYVVGEQKPFINFDFTYSRTGNKTDKRGHVALPDILFGEKIEGINVEVLTVSEIYEVTSNDGSTATGFIMKDKNDVIWHNQYPEAKYAFKDETNDRLVKSQDGRCLVKIDALHVLVSLHSALAGNKSTEHNLKYVAISDRVMQLMAKTILAVEKVSGYTVACRPCMFSNDGEESCTPVIVDYFLV